MRISPIGLTITLSLLVSLPGFAENWKGPYDDAGRKHGNFELWDDEETMIIEVVTFHNGLRHGKSTIYNPDDSFAKESSYKDGVLHGEYSAYFADGTLKEQGKYEDGNAHGTWTKYYPSGRKQAEINYDRGRLHGDFVEYYPALKDEKQSVQQRLVFRNGLKHGPAETRYNNVENSMNESGEYKEDTRTGTWATWLEMANWPAR
ncbi:hypothetical protein [uncultured Shimia sp.]|uniref:toxin-antitoxin system YwqK family antitoxin n=1 Tax=uncultured Shimia sp. TaxID=573152 RepID=UPI0026372CE2|nr:hypothetical protein [uncultured Shimia sp.]